MTQTELEQKHEAEIQAVIDRCNEEMNDLMTKPEPEQSAHGNPTTIAEALAQISEAARDLHDEQSTEHRDDYGYMLPTHPDYCASCHVVHLIDEIVVNTILTSENIIKLESAETLLKLGVLRNMYIGDE